MYNEKEILDDDRGIVLNKLLKPTDWLTLRVKSDTDVKRLAGSIYNAIIKDNRQVSLSFIGHGASGQALKALVSAQQMLSPSGKVLFFRACFEKDLRKVKPGDEKLSIQKILIYTTE